MTKPWLLDAFCCAGGAARGYQRAGWRVFGVDKDPQPRYCGDDFYQGDALEFIRAYGHRFTASHASPPCQEYSNLNAYNKLIYPDLISETRFALMRSGRPWVIENVLRAPLREPVVLCGAMFELKLYRHRGFETPITLPAPAHPLHVAVCARNGYLPTDQATHMSIHGGKHSRAWQRTAAQYMGMPWVIAGTGMEALRTGIREVCEAIPPAYTEYVGQHLMTAVQGRAA